MGFQGKSVLITGAGSGIGREAALTFARHGARVMVSDIDAAKCADIAAEIKKNGGEASHLTVNVAKYEQVRALVEKCVETYGQLDIAVNNAGIGSPMNRTSAVELSDWDRVIAVNQSGVFYCMKEELKHFEKTGSGCIVNVSSIAGLRGFQGQLPYAASKHAVIGMTRTAALEYARKNIRVNAVCPVFTRSPLLDQLFNSQEDVEEKLLRTIPMGRFGEVSDVVNAILWLASEDSSFITGLSLRIDGGQMS